MQASRLSYYVHISNQIAQIVVINNDNKNLKISDHYFFHDENNNRNDFFLTSNHLVFKAIIDKKLRNIIVDTLRVYAKDNYDTRFTHYIDSIEYDKFRKFENILSQYDDCKERYFLNQEKKQKEKRKFKDIFSFDVVKSVFN